MPRRPLPAESLSKRRETIVFFRVEKEGERCKKIKLKKKNV